MSTKVEKKPNGEIVITTNRYLWRAQVGTIYTPKNGNKGSSTFKLIDVVAIQSSFMVHVIAIGKKFAGPKFVQLNSFLYMYLKSELYRDPDKRTVATKTATRTLQAQIETLEAKVAALLKGNPTSIPKLKTAHETLAERDRRLGHRIDVGDGRGLQRMREGGISLWGRGFRRPDLGDSLILRGDEFEVIKADLWAKDDRWGVIVAYVPDDAEDESEYIESWDKWRALCESETETKEVLNG